MLKTPSRVPGRGESACDAIEEYLAALPEKTRRALERLRKAIKAAAPEATEGISYQMPVFKYLGGLVGFAARPNHCSFYPMSTTVLKGFKRDLEGYEVSGTTIHFTPDKPLPTALVKRIVQARLRENKAAQSGAGR